MSMIKRNMEDFVETLADAYGYDYDWLFDKYMHYVVKTQHMTQEQFANACKQHIFYGEVLASA